MDAFPAFFPLEGRRVVIAGTGEAAEAKARLFDGSPAQLVRLEGPQAFLVGAYGGALMAFITGDDLFVQAAAGAARAARVLVNVVDRPELCDFNTPAVIDRGAVVAAIGTTGAAPMLAALLRNDIEARVPAGAGRVAVLLKRMQAEVREAYPDLVARRAFLRAALSGEAAEAAMAGDMERGEALLRAALDRRGAPVGRIAIVAGRGPADLLTLRAARALAEADVLAADADVDPAVLALARRDAGRLSPDDAGAEALVALARAGRQVVRLITRAPDAAMLKALAGADVAVEVMLAAPAG
ncbi:MAG: siroheme synthase [Caulobacter sp.]|nr:siroheme synthase [Caulobacter sp.]